MTAPPSGGRKEASEEPSEVIDRSKDDASLVGAADVTVVGVAAFGAPPPVALKSVRIPPAQGRNPGRLALAATHDAAAMVDALDADLFDAPGGQCRGCHGIFSVPTALGRLPAHSVWHFEPSAGWRRPPHLHIL